MQEKRKHKSYSREFKEEAVALVTEQGYSVANAAEAVGIRSNMLYRWKDQLAAERAGTRLTGEERTELMKLRREVKQLKMEKDILKKASQFFAKEMR